MLVKYAQKKGKLRGDYKLVMQARGFEHGSFTTYHGFVEGVKSYEFTQIAQRMARVQAQDTAPMLWPDSRGGPVGGAAPPIIVPPPPRTQKVSNVVEIDEPEEDEAAPGPRPRPRRADADDGHRAGGHCVRPTPTATSASSSRAGAPSPRPCRTRAPQGEATGARAGAALHRPRAAHRRRRARADPTRAGERGDQACALAGAGARACGDDGRRRPRRPSGAQAAAHGDARGCKSKPNYVPKNLLGARQARRRRGRAHAQGPARRLGRDGQGAPGLAAHGPRRRHEARPSRTARSGATGT